MLVRRQRLKGAGEARVFAWAGQRRARALRQSVRPEI
jgi:hypothetical protein